MMLSSAIATYLAASVVFVASKAPLLDDVYQMWTFDDVQLLHHPRMKCLLFEDRFACIAPWSMSFCFVGLLSLLLPVSTVCVG